MRTAPAEGKGRKRLITGSGQILVEGRADVLRSTGRTALDPLWTLTPAGGIDKIPTFVSLVNGTDLGVRSDVPLDRQGVLAGNRVDVALEVFARLLDDHDDHPVSDRVGGN